MSYVISYDHGPYFRDQLIKDIQNCQPFVRCFDEQTNNQNKSNSIYISDTGVHKKGLVVTRYYRTILLVHAQATHCSCSWYLRFLFELTVSILVR